MLLDCFKMKTFTNIQLYFCLMCLNLVSVSQNQNSQWYFGNNAGINFMNSPPTSQTGSMIASEGCASVADAAGNLLFYTNGVTIYNQNHQVMANGTNLNGDISSTQSAFIAKQPG